MERRMSARALVDLPIRATLGGFSEHCRVVDLSAGGLVLRRASRGSWAAPAELVSLEFELDGNRLIRAVGRNVWSSELEHLIALRFVRVADVDRLSIAEHLDHLVRLNETLH